MGFGPFSTESDSTQNLTTVQDQGQLNKQSPVIQGSGKGAQGKRSSYAETGSIQNSTLNTAALAGANFKGVRGPITITTNDPAFANTAFSAIDDLTDQFGSTLTSIVDKVNATSVATTAATNANLDKVLAQLTPLAESKQTDGESGRNQVVLYIVLAVAAAVAAIFIFGRKS